MFTKGEKCLGKGAKKVCREDKKFVRREKNEVASKKKGHHKKFWEAREKKGELRTVKENFFKQQQQLYHMYCYGSVPCTYRDGA